ncbi:MAG: hypothetical protein Q9173_001648 [Seirophora scorigena]
MRARKDLRSITVKVIHGILRDEVASSTLTLWNTQLLDKSIAMPEQKLKGLSVTHTAGLGQPVAVPGPPNLKSRDFQAQTKPKTTTAQQHTELEKIKQEPDLKRERDEEIEEILASAHVVKKMAGISSSGGVEIQDEDGTLMLRPLRFTNIDWVEAISSINRATSHASTSAPTSAIALLDGWQDLGQLAFRIFSVKNIRKLEPPRSENNRLDRNQDLEQEARGFSGLLKASRK